MGEFSPRLVQDIPSTYSLEPIFNPIGCQHSLYHYNMPPKNILLLRNSEKYRRFFWKLSQFARNNFLQNIFQMCCKCILVLIGVVITFIQVMRVSSLSLSCWMFFLRIQKNMGLENFVKYFLALTLALRLDFTLPFIPSRTLPLFRNNRTYCPAMLS